MRTELEVRDWVMNSIGARHFYGSFLADDEWQDVDRVLDAKTARILNRQEKRVC